MRKLLLLSQLVVAALLYSLSASAVEPVVVWDTTEEGHPGNSEALSQANERMQSIKVNTRHRAEVEHWWGSGFTGTDDNGMHRHGSARCFTQDAEPTTLSDSMGTLDSITPTRLDVTDLEDSASNSGGLFDDDVGHGRCWTDTNNSNMFQMYVGVAGNNNGAWEDIKVANATLADTATALSGTGGGITTNDQILAGSANIVYNGSFEATDGTGANVDAVPSGWAAVGGPTTYSYVTSTDTRWGSGLHLKVDDLAGGEGLSFEMDGLPANTVYKVIARAKDDTVGVCTLDVTGEGGAAFTPSATTGTGTWVTLSGTFGTDVAALDDDVVITLVVTTASQTCLFDHVAVYQVGDVSAARDEVGVPGPTVVTDTTTITTGVPDTTPTDVGMAISVTPPQSNCIVQVNAVMSVATASANQEIGYTCRLVEDGSDVVISNRGGQQDGTSGWDQFADTMTMSYINANSPPGTALAYTIECADGLHGSTTGGDVSYDCTAASCDLTAIMFCGGH